MPRKYERKVGSKVYKRIPDDVLERAYAEHIAGASQNQVCKKHDVTRSVFQRYLTNKQLGESRRTPGNQTVLTHKMEKSLVDHLMHVSEWGFPFDMLDLRMTVKRILDQEGRVVSRFKESVPGKDWAYAVMGFGGSHGFVRTRSWSVVIISELVLVFCYRP